MLHVHYVRRESMSPQFPPEPTQIYGSVNGNLEIMFISPCYECELLDSTGTRSVV